MKNWPAALFAKVERIARQDRDGGPDVPLRLASVAARLGLRDEARRLAAEVERAGDDWQADAAQVHATLGDRAAVDRLREEAQHSTTPDQLGLQTFAGAYQRLGDDEQADRFVSAIDDADARTSAMAVLTHDAVANGRHDRASSLARALAAAPVAKGGALSRVLALTTARGDAATDAQTAPVAERLAKTLGDEIRDETMVDVARLWLAAGRPAEALRIARPLAERASRDFNNAWYADLAQVLVEAGDEAAGHQLLERHVEWFEQEGSAPHFARAALALARAGRTDDAGYPLRKAEEKLETTTDRKRADDARRILIDVNLAVGDVAAAIRTAADLSDLTKKADALSAIAVYGQEHSIPPNPSILQAVAASSRGGE